MDCLLYKCASFTPDSSFWQLCEDLNKIVGYGIYYVTFKIQNTNWLWFVENCITIINSNTVLCGSFGVYPSYVAGILNSVPKIHFFVLHSEKLNYTDYVKMHCRKRVHFHAAYRLQMQIIYGIPFSVNAC
jgi:hypothetical protein